ncbi:lytic transglycosylase domain-containing protein [Novosphingobium sp.]|uniref:lytic murein transglycosylase n=1 Tax=Novosphingobium sp. TaxID=1874826 RepID=UPI0025E13511|nr:lytic murein transglycosylase [Novosphingobium sp.]
MKPLRIFRLSIPALAVLAAFSAPSVPAIAQAQISQDQSFEGYLQLLGAKARSEGVSEATIVRMTAGLTVNPRVVALDQSQPGSTPGSPPAFWPYYRDHVDAARISGGRRTLAANYDRLPQIEAQYGVPGKIVVAIWGHETNYGSYKGDFDLARSLATLAYEGRRRDLFASEFIALLKMVDRGVPRERLYGSWAGAFGNPQFLPSVYLRLARDGDGDGDADIWNDRADTLASIANYFRDAGWRRGEPWGVKAYVPASFDRSSVVAKLDSPTCPRVHIRHSAWKTVSEWRVLGVTAQAPLADSTMATLFEPDGPGNGAFLLTGNYRVILQYNCSNYYALSVGLLADEIAR